MIFEKTSTAPVPVQRDFGAFAGCAMITLGPFLKSYFLDSETVTNQNLSYGCKWELSSFPRSTNNYLSFRFYQ